MRVFVQTLIKFIYAINVSIVKSYHKILSALGYKITRLYSAMNDFLKYLDKIFEIPDLNSRW